MVTPPHPPLSQPTRQNQTNTHHTNTHPKPMPPITRPCLNCRQLTTQPMRCDLCEAKHQSKRNKVRTHYQGDYKQRAAWVRANATICHICGEGERGSSDPWTADHVYPGESDSLLLAAHRSCNSSVGNKT